MTTSRRESFKEVDVNLTEMELLAVSLTETYKDAKSKIGGLLPTRISSMTPPFTQDDIITNLKTMMYSVVRAMYHSDLGFLTLERDVNHPYYEETTRDKLSDITYGIIFATSEYLLGSLLYYMDRSFIFSYIKNAVVRPNIFAMVDELREEKAKETKFKLEAETKLKIYDLVHDIVSSFIFRGDMTSLENGLKELREIKMEGTLKKDAIDYAVSTLTIICPDLLKELLYTIDNDKSMIEQGTYDRTIEIMNGLKEFYREYMITHTKDQMMHLLRRYYSIIPYNLSEVIEKTLRERNAAYSCYSPLINGLTYEELRTADAILNKRDSDVSQEIVDNNLILQNIKKIIDSHAVYDDKCYIDGDTLFIRRSDKDIREYKFKDSKVISVIDDAFRIFGNNASIVRKAFEEGKSCLQQSGCLETDREAQDIANPRSLPRLKADEAIKHRKREINKLLGQLRGSKETMNKYYDLRNQDPIKRYKYLNPLQMSYYKEHNPSTLLLKLVETDLIYDLVVERLANPPELPDVSKMKSPPVYLPPKSGGDPAIGLGGTITLNKF